MLYIILILILALLLFSLYHLRKTVSLLYDVRHYNRLAFRGTEYYYIKVLKSCLVIPKPC